MNQMGVCRKVVCFTRRRGDAKVSYAPLLPVKFLVNCGLATPRLGTEPPAPRSCSANRGSSSHEPFEIASGGACRRTWRVHYAAEPIARRSANGHRLSAGLVLSGYLPARAH